MYLHFFFFEKLRFFPSPNILTAGAVRSQAVRKYGNFPASHSKKSLEKSNSGAL